MGPKLRLSGWRARFVPNERIFPLFSWTGARDEGLVAANLDLVRGRLGDSLDFFFFSIYTLNDNVDPRREETENSM